MSDEMLLNAMDRNWNDKPCPICGDPATGHAWIYQTEFKPQNVVGEAYFHIGKDDCIKNSTQV